MKKMLGIALLLSTILCLIGGLIFVFFVTRNDDSKAYALAANDVDNLISSGQTEEASARARELRENISANNKKFDSSDYAIFLICFICIIFIVAVCIYFGLRILRPFEKLKKFADSVAVGNLDVPLEVSKGDYFGPFTFAFDNMRNELKRAKESEQEAIENNKTVIASLSHDIKTPIASIRAYAEALDMGMDEDPEVRDKYVKTIIDKCDEVSKLSEDMLMHSLADMERLKLYPIRFELGRFLEQELEELAIIGAEIEYKKPAKDIYVMADMARMSQVLENLVNNSVKYAGTKITVTLESEGIAIITFRDYGNGIPDEDIPFVFDKFYRGKNIGSEQGAGLGLYIVKYIVTNSAGSVSIRNDGGLVVEIKLPVIP